MHDSKELIRTFHDIFNTRDWPRLSAIIAPEHRFLDVPLGRTATGVGGIAEFFQVWANACPDSRAEINELHAGEHHVVDMFTFRGKHDGPLAMPNGPIPATGKKIEVLGCFVFEHRGGKLVASRNYYDVATIMGQLGLLPG